MRIQDVSDPRHYRPPAMATKLFDVPDAPQDQPLDLGTIPTKAGY
jgi:hypothetical protein